MIFLHIGAEYFELTSRHFWRSILCCQKNLQSDLWRCSPANQQPAANNKQHQNNHQKQMINLCLIFVFICSECVCHLTLSYDGIPLEELLHHDLLTLTWNLQRQTQRHDYNCHTPVFRGSCATQCIKGYILFFLPAQV